AGHVRHGGREDDADHPARWSAKWQELVGEPSRARAQIEGRLAGAERRALGGTPAPGVIAVRAEQAVPSVVSGGHLVEHLADSIGPRLLPHAHDYGRLRPDPDWDRCGSGVR